MRFLRIVPHSHVLVTYYEPNSEISSAGSTMIISVPWSQNESELPPLSTLVTLPLPLFVNLIVKFQLIVVQLMFYGVKKKKSEFPSLPHLKLPKSGIRRSRTSILRRKACYKLIFLFLKKSWL